MKQLLEIPVSGHPLLPRTSGSHTQSHKATIQRYAREVSAIRPFEYVVVHLGDGISIALHKNGSIIDEDDAPDDDCVFSTALKGKEANGFIAPIICVPWGN